MELLECQNASTSFLDRVKSVRERVLLLDYDGTLAPFTRQRNQAFPYPDVPALLNALIMKGTRVALISGRPARELATLSGFRPQPEIWGSYGLEHLTADGNYEFEQPTPLQAAGMVAALGTLQGNGFEGRVERKPSGIALHVRGLDADRAAHLRDEVLGRWTPIAAAHSLRLVNFDGGIELCVPAASKGRAIHTILQQHSPDAAIAYLGDDETDEDAFVALKGRGLAVLVRPESRPTSADLWLKPPEELYQFLHQWLLACGGEA